LWTVTITRELVACDKPVRGSEWPRPSWLRPRILDTETNCPSGISLAQSPAQWRRATAPPTSWFSRRADRAPRVSPVHSHLVMIRGRGIGTKLPDENARPDGARQRRRHYLSRDPEIGGFCEASARFANMGAQPIHIIVKWTVWRPVAQRTPRSRTLGIIKRGLGAETSQQC